MYADESFTVINKDEMDRKIVTTEDQVPPSLTQLFAQVYFVVNCLFREKMSTSN